jgi:predicted extracellular nuclease
MASTYYVAFWNVENLFDVEDSPRRSEKVRRAIGRSIEGWTPALLDRKIAQLSSIIVQMNGGAGPDLLGVCEVENEFVVTRLVDRLNQQLGRNLQVVHDDSSDKRGIDLAFIYDPLLFTPVEQFTHVVMRRTATREIFQVNLDTHRGRRFAIMGNHWPSRSGGPPIESAGYRAIAGETLAYFHQRVLEVHGKDTPVLAMGDFNDEPLDESLVKYALGGRSRTKVINASSPRLLNLMWPIMGAGVGTHYYGNWPSVLDQFLVNKNLLKTAAAIRVQDGSATVLRRPEMMSGGDYPQPIRFGGMGKSVNQDGFSDHFPIAVQIEEDD